MSIRSIKSGIAFLGAVLLQACAPHGAMPVVSVQSNPSGIKVGRFTPFDAYDTIGPGKPGDKEWDNPPGVSAEVKAGAPIKPRQGTYQILPGGTLKLFAIGNTNSYRDTGKAVLQWQGILDKRDAGRVGNAKQLEEIPWMNAAQVFHAKARIIDCPWGRAALFLTSYVQGGHGDPVNNDELTLVIQGITRDRRYFVSAHIGISHPRLPKDAWDENHENRVYFPIDSTNDGRAEAWLNQQADDSFFPSISSVQTMLENLRISAP